MKTATADLRGNVQIITEAASGIVGVARASVWLYGEGRSSIVELDLFDASTREHGGGTQLRAAEYPEYFAALEAERVIAADDAQEDHATRCFAEDYLRPLGITSMLDAPVRAGGSVTGVLCLEHVGAPRQWSEEERSLAGTLADFASLTIEGHNRWSTEEDLRKTREELARVQHFDALSRLAGGVAHDTNNFLTIVLGHAELIRRELPLDSPIAAQVAEIQWAAQQASGVIRQLLSTSRRQLMDSCVVDLGSVIEAMQTTLRTALGERVAFDCRYGENLGKIKIDAGRMEQILLNLVVNARDAMPRGGSLSITARNETALRSGRVEWVVLEVTDSGTGIEPAVQERMFEAFFTTKVPGRGTGLGLSIVRDFVSQAGGDISVRTAPGRGTTFTLRFPRLREERALALDGGGEPIDRSLSEGKCILFVEDQPELGLLAKASLETYGYSVLVAHDIDEAVGCCLSNPGPIDLMLTDIELPGATGLAVARAVQKLRPSIKVLFMSGYPEADLEALDGEPLPSEVLQKPYTPETLARAVADGLSARAVPSVVPEPDAGEGAAPAARRPEIRASYFKAVISGVKKLPEPQRGEILRAAGDPLRSQIREAALLDWLPGENFILIIDAIAATLGEKETLAFWKASMHASLQRFFLATLRTQAIRNYGNNPASLVSMAPRAWRLLSQACGGCETQQTSPSSMVMRFTNLPPIMRKRSLAYLMAGGSLASIEETGFEGTASIRDDGVESGNTEVLVEWRERSQR